MAKKKESEVVEVQPGDDVAEAQPSIEREDAATGRTGTASPSGANESGGSESAPAGNP